MSACWAVLYQFLQFLHIRQSLAHFLRHLVSRLICGHTHWLRVVANHKLHVLAIGTLAQYDADAGILVRLAASRQESLDTPSARPMVASLVEELPQITGLELTHLQLYP